jgi:L-asparaginase / beta-aspartyl-peptidase
MKSIILVSVTLILIIIIQFVDITGKEDKKNERYVIVIHGGAGSANRNLPDSLKEVYYQSLKEALDIGKKILERDGNAIDAVEKVINYLEDNQNFNAGKGAVFTSEGTHELDASIMNGADLSCGAVAGVKHIKNPVSLARLVMEKSPHVLFAGEGAEQFGKEMNIKLVDNNYFDTEARLKSLNDWRRKKVQESKGTVGCVVRDKKGNLAAGTSTGGMTGKRPGRIGDSPITGAGNYANNKTCAVSATGMGELFIRNTVAYNISALMEYKNLTLKEASEIMIYKTLPDKSGGIIAVDKDGNFTMDYNTESMLRGMADSDGNIEVKIWQ